MPLPFTIDHEDRRIEVRLDDIEDRDRRLRDVRVRLFVDDVEMDAASLVTKSWVLVLRDGELEVHVTLSVWGTRIKRAHLVAAPGATPIPLVEVADAVDPLEGSPDGPEAAEQRRTQRAKRWCVAAFGLLVIYGLALRPIRPLLLGSPLALSALTGSRTAVVILGAFVATGRTDLWWLGIALATISVVKFDPVFWWAGRLWGDRVVDLFGGRSLRSGRIAARGFDLVRRWRTPAIVATWVVPVVPPAVVYAAAGASGMRLRTFLLVDLSAAFCTRCFYCWLGYRLGQPVVDVLDAIDDFTLWFSLALVVGTIAAAWLRQLRDRSGREERADLKGALQEL
ncbi:MAG: DedA family protein [Nocardioides sp.]